MQRVVWRQKLRDGSIGRSVEKGALGWECWDGSMGMGAWGKESGNENTWMGERERERRDGILQMVAS